MQYDFDIIAGKEGFVGPSFSLINRIKRAIWQVTWLLAARWTPVPFHRWRILVLRLYGANVSFKAYVYPSVDIWAPWNLEMADFATLASDVRCYNIAKINIKQRAIISQYSFLCTGTHNFRDPNFPLVAKSIEIGERAWICAVAFVGPGVVVGDGAVLAAASVTFKNLEAWHVYLGNPATVQSTRSVIIDGKL